MSEQLEPRTLTEAIALYGNLPEDHPQTLADLMSADPDQISHPLAQFLVGQAVALVRSHERHYVRTPEDVLRYLSNKQVLHEWEGAWVAYALSGDRQVVLVPDSTGRVRSLRKATKLLPKFEDLPAIPASAHAKGKKPAWLIIYGGTPEVLSKPHVAQGLATLARRTGVADVCFYHSDPDEGVQPSLWSLRGGCGATSSGLRLEFPDQQKVEEVKLNEPHQ